MLDATRPLTPSSVKKFPTFPLFASERGYVKISLAKFDMFAEVHVATPAPEASESLKVSQDALTAALRSLHRAAGMPSTREISSAVRDRDDLRDTVSHETVGAILRGESIPRWIKLECVVRQLAEWAAHRPEPDLVVLEIHRLWLACRPSRNGGLGDSQESRAVIEEAAMRARLENNLFISSEDAAISYVDGAYEITIARQVVNRGTDPVTHYPVRIVVDRYPDEPERSRRHHEELPLTWSELAFEGWCDDKPMAWRALVDRPAEKVMSLLFLNGESEFALAPGATCTLAYSYRGQDDKWGPWFSRRMRTSTGELTITADFPANPRPVVWCVNIAPTTQEEPIRIPLSAETSGAGRVKFKWNSKEVPARTISRLEWAFRSPPRLEVGRSYAR